MKCSMAKYVATCSLGRILRRAARIRACSAKRWNSWIGWLYAICMKLNRQHSGTSNLGLARKQNLLIQARSKQRYFFYLLLLQQKKRVPSRIPSASYNGETKQL